MGTYVVNSKKEQQELLTRCGLNSFVDLYKDIPEEVLLKDGLNLPKGLAELEVKRKFEDLADKNKVYKHIFRGAGAYNHYIPSVVKAIASKEEFVTAYTPYQAEISQGILQAIFEFQTMICELTGMQIANASVYSFGHDIKVELVPEKNGITDIEALKTMIDNEASCFYVQQPNYFGNIEDLVALGEVVHKVKAKYIVGANPIALAVLQTPAQAGADIVVGEAQPLGLPLGFGGPYLGFMATTDKMMRKLPGRLVGQTVDVDGKRAFVLTLQAREQHIRREKASSNICSNQQWCALVASIYLATMGAKGLVEVAEQSVAKAHYLAEELSKAGLTLKYQQPYFHEFVTVSAKNTQDIMDKLAQNNILGGLPLNEREILWCATEMNTKEEIDKLVELVKAV